MCDNEIEPVLDLDPRTCDTVLVCITLVYLYDEAALDVDNFIKPIEDALVGLAFSDDSVNTEVSYPPSTATLLNSTSVDSRRYK